MTIVLPLGVFRAFEDIGAVVMEVGWGDLEVGLWYALQELIYTVLSPVGLPDNWRALLDSWDFLGSKDMAAVSTVECGEGIAYEVFSGGEVELAFRQVVGKRKQNHQRVPEELLCFTLTAHQDFRNLPDPGLEIPTQ